jgi:hypothetical protein
VAVVDQEHGLSIPPRPRIALEERPPEPKGRGGDVDRDRLAAEAVEKVRDPTGSSSELEHHVVRSDPEKVKQHTELEQVQREISLVGERLAEDELGVGVLGEVALRHPVELVGAG